MTLMLRVLTIIICLALTGCGRPIIIAPDAVLPDGGLYKGELLDGKFHGHGELLYQAGSYYVGSFKAGVFHGRGIWVDADGTRYEGQFVEGVMNGFFTVDYAQDNASYAGNMQDWLYHGEGRLENQDGSTYDGEFENGKYHGVGKLTHKTGASYEGSFANGAYHGQGRFTQEESVYEGTFIEGHLNGEGESTDKEGNHYQGELKNWLANGDGKMTTTDGDVFTGVFENGYLTGEGEMYGADGSRYMGNFLYGKFDGVGVLTNADKSVYQGQFSYGDYHGQGELTTVGDDNKKAVVSGKWREGSLIHNDATGERYHYQAELALEHHQRLLEMALDRLQASRPNQADMYFLGVAGDGSQSVFRRELEYVDKLVQDRYGTENRSISLINHHDTATLYPLATNRSIESAILEINKKMNVDQDILFMYLSSHGSKEHELYLNHDSINLPTLPAKSLSTIFAKSTIKWKVIMISACYSGGFVAELEDEYTIVITASDSTNTSFGCSEDSDMTYFGKAFFKETLSVKPELSLIDAFAQASELVSEWEQEQELTESNPQISAPEKVLEKLNSFKH